MKRKMKSEMKKLLALVCVLTLGVGCIAFSTQIEEVKASEGTTEVTPVYLEGFRNITLSSFKDKDNGTQFPDTMELVSTSNTSATQAGVLSSEESFDKTLLSLWAEFGAGTTDRRLDIATKANDGGEGIRFQASNDTTFAFRVMYSWVDYKVNNESQTLSIKATDLLGAGAATTDRFLLQFSIEYGDLDENTNTIPVKVGLYANGKMYDRNSNSQEDEEDKFTFYLPQAALGSGFRAYAKNTTLKVESCVPQPQPVYLQGFRHITLSSFTATGGTELSEGTQFPDTMELVSPSNISATQPGVLTNIQQDTDISFDRTLLSLWAEFGAGTTDRRLDIATKANDGGEGIRFQASNDTTFAFRVMYNWVDYKVNNESQTLSIKATDLLGAGAATTDRFLLQFSIEYGDLDENTNTIPVKVGLYANGKMYDRNSNSQEDEEDKFTFYLPQAALGSGFRAYAKNTTLKVESCVPEKRNLTPLTLADFNVDNGDGVNRAYVSKSISGQSSGNIETYSLDTNTHSNIEKLGNTSLEVNIRLEKVGDSSPRFHYGTIANYAGISFTIDGENLRLASTVETMYFNDPASEKDHTVIKFDPTIAGVGSTFNGTEFTLKVTNNTIDYDRDGTDDSVELGVFINGKLYNNQYIYIKDYQTYSKAGNCLGITAEQGKVTVRSTPQVKEVIQQLNANEGYTELENKFNGVNSVLLGNTAVENFSALTTPGDYTVKGAKNAVIGQVVLYKTNDTHPDGNVDVADLVAMLKVQNGIALSTWSGTMGAYAADFNETGIINSILGIETVSE